MLEEEGAHAYTLETAERLTAKALSDLQQAACGNDAADALFELTQSLLKRKN